MNIFLTMDYEVFFGDSSGSVEKCMIEPTRELLDLAKRNNFRFTFFWDVGHFIAIESFMAEYPAMKDDYQKIKSQVERMVDEGHDVQLHIHPHWEKAKWTNGNWDMNLEKHYKLSDFQENERSVIFSKYKSKLEEITKKKSAVFRAGGWCIQPFSDFKALFLKHDMKLDSSVMPGIQWKSDQYDIDFKNVPIVDQYYFEDDVCVTSQNGAFIEVPITSRNYSPIFFWKLYGLGRLFPFDHKMWGDGNFISQPGGKKEMLTKGKMHHVSTDGYFASKLESSFEDCARQNRKNLCVIGHPKSLTKFSLKKIDQFTTRNIENKRFMTLSEVI